MHLLCGVVPARFIKYVLKTQLNSLCRRAARLILPDLSLSTPTKLKAIEIIPSQEQFMYNTDVLVSKVHMGLTPQ